MRQLKSQRTGAEILHHGLACADLKVTVCADTETAKMLCMPRLIDTVSHMTVDHRMAVIHYSSDK